MTEPADLFLFLHAFGADEARLASDLDALERLLDLSERTHRVRPGVLGIVVNSAEGAPPLPEMDAARARLQIALAGRPNIARHMAPALDVATFMRFRLDGTFDPESDRRYHIAELVHLLVAELPNEARLEMARLSGAREAQAKIAQTLIKSTAAVCGALGAQPIPLADLPFLLTFQLAMVSGIIYISGREMSLKLGTEFLGTMGINFGLGLALREGARAAIRAASKLLLTRCRQRDQRVRGGQRDVRRRAGRAGVLHRRGEPGRRAAVVPAFATARPGDPWSICSTVESR